VSESSTFTGWNFLLLVETVTIFSFPFKWAFPKKKKMNICHLTVPSKIRFHFNFDYYGALFVL
jgi:hypothetical protein